MPTARRGRIIQGVYGLYRHVEKARRKYRVISGFGSEVAFAVASCSVDSGDGSARQFCEMANPPPSPPVHYLLLLRYCCCYSCNYYFFLYCDYKCYRKNAENNCNN